MGRIQVLLLLVLGASAEWANSPNCGLRDDGRRKLVVNGQLADPYMFPWQVGLNYFDSGEDFYDNICGGAVLNEDWILTAAHCVSDGDGQMRKPEDFVVIAGDYNYTSEDTDVRQVKHIEAFIMHEDYDNDQLRNDIALIKLKDPLTLSSSSPWKVNPICLPTNGSLNYGEEILVSGWGRFDDDIPSPDEMHWNSLILRNDLYCRALAGDIHYDAETSICFDKYEPNPIAANPEAQLHDNAEGVCRGDSGGSAVQKRSDGRFYSEGVASKVVHCGNLLSTIIYAETRHYVDWIDDNIANYDPANNPVFDDECSSRSSELHACVKKFIAMNCPGGNDDMVIPKCHEPWMEKCGIEPDFTDCTEISECGSTVLKEQPHAHYGSDYCHESCETCGYDDHIGILRHYARLCTTCPAGYEIEPNNKLCAGYCVPIGQATRNVECSRLPSTLECVREPNTGSDEENPVEPAWTGEVCSEDQITNVFSYAYCGGAPRGSCEYPIDPSACAEGFTMCRQDAGDYRCYPIDGVGGPRVCEQCFLDGENYFKGECYEASEGHIRSKWFGPNGVTALYAATVDDCPDARTNVRMQLDCVRQQSQSDCCTNSNCKWSESAQLCYWESLISLNDSVVCGRNCKEVITSSQDCRRWADLNNKEQGGAGYAFSGNYGSKGCYYYKTGKYAGRAYWGIGGSSEQQGALLSEPKHRAFTCDRVESESSTLMLSIFALTLLIMLFA